MTDEQCDATKNSGESCDNPAKYADGKCGVHSQITDGTQGRPTKFTDGRARLAIDAAREGKSKRGCERAAGVGEGTLNGWLEQGYTFENADGLMDGFSRAFTQARAEGESTYIADGRDPDGDSSFAKFMLSSSYGYSKETEVNVGGQDGNPLQIEFSETVVETPWQEQNPDE